MMKLAVIFLAVCVTVMDGVSNFAQRNRHTANMAFRSFEALLQEMPETLQRMNNFVRMESARERIHEDYTRMGRADRSIQHDVVIAVKQRNLQELERILHDVSDPSSSNYGSHLSNQQVADLTSNPESAAHVEGYLRQHGVTVLSSTPHGDYITARADVSTWETILNCEFHEYEAKRSAAVKVVRTSSYSLEDTVAGHILAVFNTVHFPPAHAHAVRHKNGVIKEQELSSVIPHGYVTPALLKATYGIDSNGGNTQASQGVYESIGQTFSPVDLTTFQRHFNLTVEAVAVDIGGHNTDRTCRSNGGEDCVEANLDVQYLMAVAPHIPTTYYYWGGEDFMVDWLVKVAAMSAPPKVISISYGMDEDYLTEAYGIAFNTQAMKLGVQGVTLVASSGDDGAAGSNARDNAFLCGYRPSFPASSPYVTAVGGTMGPENGHAETVCQADHGGIITSGGGFSGMYPAPAFQQAAVQGYLDRIHGTSNDALRGYNRAGRGYPDISALAFNYVIALNHNFTTVSGTSASSPVVAGMISLVNAARLAAGKASLGWVNPALYDQAALFARDITSGDNRCVADATVCCGHGFFATEGWDAVTGLGVVNFALFKQAFLSLGKPIRSPTLSPTKAPHGPTLRPTRLPPSVKPTAAPTTAQGWISITSYAEENCEGTALTVSAMPSSVCMELYDADRSPTGSTEYVCHGDGTAMVSYYSDASCTSSKLTDSTRIFLGCAYKVSSYYDPSVDTSSEVSCSTGASSLPPLPAYDGSFVVHTAFSSVEGCVDGMQSSVDASLHRHCFDIASKGYSYKFQFPKASIYDGLGCLPRKLKSSVDLNTACEQTTGDDDVYSYYDDGDARRLQENSNAYYGDDSTPDLFDIWALADTAPIIPILQPSSRPSSVPTASPTAKPTTYPTDRPYSRPTSTPTLIPTTMPSFPSGSSDRPSARPVTGVPTIAPTPNPSAMPSPSPTTFPTLLPIPFPTMLPSQFPSMPPIVFPVTTTSNISIALQQILDGVGAEAFKSSKTFAVFQAAVLANIGGVTVDAVVFQGVSDVSQSAKLSVLTSARCNVSYALQVNLSKQRYATSLADAVNVVGTQIHEAVQTGQFNTALTHYAAALQAPSLLHVTSSEVAVVSVTATSPHSTSSSVVQSKGLIGALLGLGVLSLVLGIILLYKCSGKIKQRRLSYAQVSLGSDSVHASVTVNPLAVQHQRGGGDEETGHDGEIAEIELSSRPQRRQQPLLRSINYEVADPMGDEDAI